LQEIVQSSLTPLLLPKDDNKETTGCKNGTYSRERENIVTCCKKNGNNDDEIVLDDSVVVGCAGYVIDGGGQWTKNEWQRAKNYE